MCILAILYQKAKNAPILVAGNREEAIDRPTQAPKIQSGTPRVVCGIDRRAGGTWFGINQHGLMATVSNARKREVPLSPRSRGLLCRELLSCANAREATDMAESELASGAYDGAHYLVADSRYGAVVLGGDRVQRVDLIPGLHILSETGLDNFGDPRQEMVRRMLTLQTLDSSVTFLAVASRTFSKTPDLSAPRRGSDRGGSRVETVSSALLSLSERIQNSVFQYAPGPPTDTPYDDLSALLRQVLSTGKSKRRRAAEEDDDYWSLAD